MKSFTRRLLLALPLPYFVTAAKADDDRDPVNRPLDTSMLWHRTELYFGTGRPNGLPVSDIQFSQFVDQQVTPRFPDGLTLLAGYGQFKGSSGVINKEKSFLLILFYAPEMKDAGKLIEQIRATYKTMFSQESVLRADSQNLVSF